MEGENIDLGSFDWDISQIEKDLISNKIQLEAYSAALQLNKKQLAEQRKQVQDTAKVLALSAAAQEELNKALTAGTISEEEHTAAIHALNVANEEARSNVEDMAEAQANLIKQNLEMERSVKLINEENRSLNSLLQSGRTEVEGNETAYKDLNKELNALKLESKNLGAQMVMLERNGQATGEEYETLKKRWQDVSAQADELNSDFKRLDKSVGDNQRTVGDYKDQITSAFSEITLGFSQIKNGDFAGGFDKIKTSIGGVTSNFKAMSLALLSNPLTLVLAALTGVALGFKQILDYNTEQLPKMRLIQNAFGDMGDQADILRTKINGVEESYGLTFDRILSTVDSISSSGLSTEVEAIDAIKKGLATAPDASEFLSKLDAAASKARQTGISLNEVLNLTKALQGTAIDPGTIYGGIEKASNRLQMGLKENTELVSAFGETFARDILGKVQTGQITTVEALEQVRLKGEEVNITVSQQAALGKSLFGKLAANAGAYTETLRLVGEAYKDQFADLTDLQIITKRLSDENEELAVAKDKALKSDSVIALKEEFSIFFKQIEIGFYNFLAWLRKADKAFLGSSQYMRGLFMSIPDAAKSAFSSILSAFAELLKGIGAGGGAFTKFFKGDIEGAKAEADRFINALPNFFKKIQTVGKTFNKSVGAGGSAAKSEFDKNYDLRQAGLAAVAKQNEAKAAATAEADLDDKAKDKKAKAEKSKKAEKDPKIKMLEDAAKRAIEIAKDEADQKMQIAKLELANYISANADKFKNDKSLAQAKLQEQLKYLDSVKSQQEQINALERQAKEQAVQIKVDEINAKEKAGKKLTENDIRERSVLNEQLLIIDQEYKAKDLELEQQTAEKKKEIDLAYTTALDEQKKLHRAIDAQQQIIDLEAKGDNEYAMRQLQLQQQTDLDLSEFIKKNELLKEAEQGEYEYKTELDLARKELQAEIDATDDENERLRLSNQLGELNLIEQANAEQSKQIAAAVDEFKLQSRAQVLSGLAGLFGQESVLGKAFALAQIANDTVTNASKAFTQASVFASNPLTAALAPNAYIQGGIIIATGAAQAAKLVLPKKQLYTGGYTGAGGKYETADDIQIHRGEMVWSQEDVRAVGGADIANAMRPSQGGFMAGGMMGSALSNVQASAKAENISVSLPESALQDMAQAIYQGAQGGIADMADNKSIQQGANF